MENVNKALEDALTSLNMSSEQLYLGKRYTIVEFCQEYLGLSINETVKLSRELVNELPVVYINEIVDLNKVNAFQKKYVNQPLSTAASAVGNRIRQSAQNKLGVGSTGNRPDPKAQVGWNQPITKISQSFQNALNTKSAALRNSPMLKISDNVKGIDKYLAFPDLDLSRPGHGAILNNIKDSLTKDGITAETINLNNVQRIAAQQAGQYAEISSPDKHDQENKKQAISKVLDQLDQIVASNKDKISKFSFMSPEELADIQQQVTMATGQAAQIIANSATDAKTSEANLVNAAETSIELPPSATTSATTSISPAATPAVTPATTPTTGGILDRAFDIYNKNIGGKPTNPQGQAPMSYAASAGQPAAPTTLPIDANEEAAAGSETTILPGTLTPEQLAARKKING